VLHFNGDIRASAVSALREEITAILTMAEKTDEILVCLDSGGGLVNAYGLAASQLQRIKDAKIKLIIAIDKVAASGGYMMACIADRIIAAPFAIIGSIGVLAQIPNFHRFLQKKSIDFEQLTAGQYKRTLTLFGENTEKAREKMQQEIDDTHELFKTFIHQHRPNIDIEKVSTGEHWYATTALNLNLVDALQTSDDYLLSASKQADIYEICFKLKKSLGKRLSANVAETYHKLFYL
jgi:serine protease SohB